MRVVLPILFSAVLISCSSRIAAPNGSLEPVVAPAPTTSSRAAQLSAEAVMVIQQLTPVVPVLRDEPVDLPPAPITAYVDRPIRVINPLWFNGENVDQREWAYATGDYGDDPSIYGYGVVRIWDVPFWSSTADQVDEAVKRAKNAGLEPMLIIMNPKVNDPAWAASRVQHFQDIGYPVKYFEIGNENDINDSSTPDGPLDGNGAGYADAFNATYDAMKAVDPSVRVGGPAVSGLGGFFETFLQRSGSRTDFVSYHNYAPWADQDGEYGFRRRAEYARGLVVRYVTDSYYRNKSDVFLFLGEWDHASQNAPNAVYFLSAVYWQIEGGLDMAVRYQHNDYWREEFGKPWSYSLYNPDGSRSSAFYYHEIVRDYLGDQVVDTDSDDDQVLALGTQRSTTGEVNLLVINMKSVPVSKSIEIDGVTPDAAVRVVLWNDQVYPPQEHDLVLLTQNRVTYTIPAKSTVVFSVNGGR
ncbi:MAG: hypothetical protein HY675_18105 [Chloroflexi bacterium]|nr:hypothetical protein [Chloroflexota bacterium]